jgi:thioredoxin 1
MSQVISGSQFDEVVLKSDVPVAVDFFATWCMPCKMISPFLEQLEAEYKGKAKVFKIDVDQDGQLAEEFGVKGVPTVIFFKGGKRIDEVVGAVPKDAIESRLKALV